MISIDIAALLKRVNDPCIRAIEAAAGACLARGHYEVTVEHVWSKLLEAPGHDVALILGHFNGDVASYERTVNTVLDELNRGHSGKPVFSPRFLEWLQEAWLISSIDWQESSIRSGALLMAMLARPERFVDARIMEQLRMISREKLQAEAAAILKTSVENFTSRQAPEMNTPSGQTMNLDKYCTDFTRKAAANQVDPVFGRDREIYQIIDILTRRRKNNPILVGEAGVGKTAVVEGLALRIVQGNVPDALKGVSIVGLDIGLLQAGAGVQGEFEHRLKSLIQEIKASPQPIILFIDEAHTLIGAGGSPGGTDAANLLKPALARGELRTIAATTWSEYKKYFEKDPALARRFQPVKLEEPTIDQAITILRGLKSCYEEAHGVTVRDSAIIAAAEYSGRYIAGRQLPDKAVDLLDTSAARVKGLLTAKPAVLEDKEREQECLIRERVGIERDALHGETPRLTRLQDIEKRLAILAEDTENLKSRWMKERDLAHRLIGARNKVVEAAGSGAPSGTLLPLKQDVADMARELQTLQGNAPLVPTEVDADTVAKVVSDWTGIPLGKVLRDETQNVMQLESNLGRRIKGQEDAVRTIGEVLRSSKVGLHEPHQPLGVFLLVGPSGVGKTETALAIADLLFGGDRFLHTINMSEFQESHSISRLIGSPPGYVGYGEGGLLTEAVRQKPYSVVLIDEVEKGHLDVLNLFYQVFDKGTLSDGEGRAVDFKNTVLFLTSNLASDDIIRMCSTGHPLETTKILEAIRPKLMSHFKPALLARMTVVPYRPLETPHVTEIIQSKLGRLADRIQQTHGFRLSFSESLASRIAGRCLDNQSGARTIDRFLNGTILPQLSRELIGRMGQEKTLSDTTIDISEDGTACLFTS